MLVRKESDKNEEKRRQSKWGLRRDINRDISLQNMSSGPSTDLSSADLSFLGGVNYRALNVVSSSKEMCHFYAKLKKGDPKKMG